MKPEIVKVVEALLEYIDALPEDVVARLPTMPGVDRDWVEQVVTDYTHHDVN